MTEPQSEWRFLRVAAVGFGLLGLCCIIAAIAIDLRSSAEAQDYVVESIPLIVAPPAAEAAAQPRPRQLLIVRVLRRPCSEATLREVGRGVRESLNAQGLHDVAAIVHADWLEVRLESLGGER